MFKDMFVTIIVIKFNYVFFMLISFLLLFMFIACKIRSLAPSKTGKRPLLSDISNSVTPPRLVLPVHQPKKKICRNIKNVQIPEYKAITLSSDDVQVTQEIISEHVSVIC